MKWSLRQSLSAMALAGMLSWPHLASAGLGPIQVLSDDGDKFAALIPFVDEMPGSAVMVALADRNRYPMIGPYSASASQLTFNLQRSLDGTPTGILVMGPAKLAEPELRFAVQMSWASGGAVREYEVDARRPHSRKKVPLTPNDHDKKTAAGPHLFPPFAHFGLGDLKIKSLPGQPFVAETEVFGNAASLQQRLRVRISPLGSQQGDAAEALKLLASMHHSLIRSPSGATLLQLTSDLPAIVDVFSFRLDVSLGTLHMARRYQVETHTGNFSVAEHAVSVSRHPAPFKVLRVMPGDSLSSIAKRLRRGSTPLRDVIERLYQENPQAFISGDINRLVAGAQLKYPQAWLPVRNTAAPAPAVHPAPAAPVVAPAPAAHPAAAVHAAPDAHPAPAAHAAPASASAQVVPPPAPRKMEPSAEARKVQEAALRAHVQQQQQMLSQAQKLSHDLEARLRTLSAQKGVVPAPAGKHPSPAVPPRPQASRAVVTDLESGAALVVAAAATALALRRRRLRLAAEGKPVASVATTVEGMREQLRYDPANNELRYRLLQLLASQDDRQGFVAEALQAAVHFDQTGPMWRGVVEMGRVVAPDYPWAPLPDDPVVQEGDPADPVPQAESSAGDDQALPGETGSAPELDDLALPDDFLSEPGLDDLAMPDDFSPEPEAASQDGTDRSPESQAPAATSDDMPVTTDQPTAGSATVAEPATEPAPVVAALTAAEPMVSQQLPERPLMEEADLDDIASAGFAFREPAQSTVFDRPEDVDKQELAKLYMEMGDTDAARELLGNAGPA